MQFGILFKRLEALGYLVVAILWLGFDLTYLEKYGANMVFFVLLAIDLFLFYRWIQIFRLWGKVGSLEKKKKQMEKQSFKQNRRLYQQGKISTSHQGLSTSSSDVRKCSGCSMKVPSSMVSCPHCYRSLP